MKFEELHLIQPLLKAVLDAGYQVPTPIQQQTIPYVLEGRDAVSYTHLTLPTILLV